MRYRKIPESDLKVSVLGFGTARLRHVKNVREKSRLFTLALDRGVNHFDFAPTYGDGDAERSGGRWLPSSRRDRLILSTKVPPDLTRKNIKRSLEASLRRLNTDYVDVLYMHRFDPTTPLSETLEAVADLASQGKIRYWGTSEWPVEALFIARALCEHRGYPSPLLEQKHLSFSRHSEYLEQLKPNLRKLKMSVVGYSVFDRGLLLQSRTKVLDKMVRETGASRVQLALSWALKNPGVCSVLVGATSAKQLDENLSSKLSADFFKLT